MSNREPKDWITVNHKHIPIFEGESKDDAYNRAVAQENEEKKQADIQRNKEQADKLNDKSTKIHCDISKSGKYQNEAKACVQKLNSLANEYNTTAVSYTVVPSSLQEGGGAYMLDNQTAISVSANSLRVNKSTDQLRLGNNQIYGSTFHEFAHSLAQSRQMRDTDKAFWKELKALKRKYQSESSSPDWFTKKRISTYADKDIDEFFAEGFTQAKLSDNPSPYALQVLGLVDKYFKVKKSN